MLLLGLLEIVSKELESCGLQHTLIGTQLYDGALVMSGHLSGVQQYIKEDNPFAI